MAHSEPGAPLISQVEKEPELEVEPIPDVEWWDARILSSGVYEEPREQADAGASGEPIRGLNRERITSYVEHPVPLEPPAEGEAPPPRPLMLTKKVPMQRASLPLLCMAAHRAGTPDAYPPR